MQETLEQWRNNGEYFIIKPNGWRLFYRQWGDKSALPQDTLLLLHGFPESSFSFHKVVSGLLSQFKRIVVFDMLGYGFSDKPNQHYSYSLIAQTDIACQLWQHLGVRGGHVLSHDMGTSVLTELLTRQVTSQLPAFFDVGLLSATFTNGSMVLQFARLRLMQRLLLSRIGCIVSQFSRYTMFKRSILSAHGGMEEHGLNETDIKQLWESFSYDDGHKKSHGTIRYLNDRKRFEQSRWLPALSQADKVMPIHLCWGEADHVARIEMAHYLAREHCPQATLSVMKGVGHFCQIGSPDIWLKNIRNFYQGM